MYDKYEDACEATLTAAQTSHCINVEHGLADDDMSDFIAFRQEYGEHDAYSGQDVLNWLGY